MGYSHFLYDYVIPNMAQYISILFIVAILFSILYTQVMCDKLEIFFLWTCYFGEIFSIADVIFMYKKGLISNYYFSNFVITTGVFFVSIVVFQRLFKLKKKYKLYVTEKKEFNVDERLVDRYATFVFFCFVILSCLKIFIFGVRSFEKVGGGSGAIIRFLWIITPMSNFCNIYLLFTKYRKKAVFFIIVNVIFTFFSGSKSAVLSMVFMLFIYLFINPSNIEAQKIIKKIAIPMVFLGIICGTILGGLLNSRDGIKPVEGIVHRFIAYGDIYTFSYSEDVLQKVYGGSINFFRYLFGDFLTTFRIVDRSYVEDLNLAGKLVECVAGPGITAGPNPRFNVLGLAFFGYTGSIIFSILCGFVFSFVHKIFVEVTNKPFQKQLIAYVILVRLIDLEQDAMLISQFITEMILFTVIYAFMILLFNRDSMKLFINQLKSKLR